MRFLWMIGVIAGCCVAFSACGRQSGQKSTNLQDSENLTSQHRRKRIWQDYSRPEVGDIAPPFKLRSFDNKSETTLQEFRDEKPVVLIFGSYT